MNINCNFLGNFDINAIRYNTHVVFFAFRTKVQIRASSKGWYSGIFFLWQEEASRLPVIVYFGRGVGKYWTCKTRYGFSVWTVSWKNGFCLKCPVPTNFVADFPQEKIKKSHTQYFVSYTTNLHIQVVYYILRSSLLVRKTVAKHHFQGYALHCYKQC